jgi:hypothetical protein
MEFLVVEQKNSNQFLLIQFYHHHVNTKKNIKFEEIDFFVLADSHVDLSASSPTDRRTSGSLFARKMMIPNNQQQQPAYIEVFIPPRASIVNYFMAKVKK